jgi:hypothetical protein
MNKIGGFTTGLFGVSACEISAYDPDSLRIYVIDGQQGRLRVLDAENPALAQFNQIAVFSFAGGANSVAYKNGLIAVAVGNNDKTMRGNVVFINSRTLAKIDSVQVGYLPDMLAFTPDGSKIVVANEGEPTASYTADPEGSIGIIEVATRTYTEVGFTSLNGTLPHLADLYQTPGAGLVDVRIYGEKAGGKSTVAEDLEPEYITVSEDNKTAWAVCQENNAMVQIDLVNKTLVTAKPIFGLGYMNRSLAGNQLDGDDRDGAANTDIINRQLWPIFSTYQPDGIATVRYNGKTYLLGACEGDDRDDWFTTAERTRLSTFALNATSFPNAAAIQAADNGLARLNVSRFQGDTAVGGGNDLEMIIHPGGRCLAIWDTAGARIWDSGGFIEATVQQKSVADPNHKYNASRDNNTQGNRSDDNGPEPEGLVLGTLGDSTYAFVGLERDGGIMVWNVTNPTAPTYVHYHTDRNWAQTPAANAGGDLSPEGLAFIDPLHNIRKKALLIASYEISGSVGVIEINGIKPYVLADKKAVSLTQVAGTPGAASGASVSGYYLAGAVSVTVTSPFQISLSQNGPWATSLSLSRGTLNELDTQKVYVRLNATAAGSYTAEMAISSLNATNKQVNLTGTTTQAPTARIARGKGKSFRVFPVPVQEVLNVEVETPGLYRLYSLEGSVLLTLDAPSPGLYKLETSSLAKGSYILGGAGHWIRIVKQ